MRKKLKERERERICFTVHLNNETGGMWNFFI